MSELELKKRQAYKRSRRNSLLAQLAGIIMLLAISLTTLLIYNGLCKSQIIDYTENGSVEYKVKYLENDLYEDEWIAKDKTYDSSLTQSVYADFTYDLIIDSKDGVDVRYTYWIDATLTVNEKDGTTHYVAEDRIFDLKSIYVNGCTLVDIREVLTIDYLSYNELAKAYIASNNIENADSKLEVTLIVDTYGKGEEFVNTCKNSYSSTISIPMAEESFSITTTQTAVANEVKTFDFQGTVSRSMLLISAVVGLVLVVSMVIEFLIFSHVTKDKTMYEPIVEETEPQIIPEEPDELPDGPGILVIDVVWPNKAKKNKAYRYDPDEKNLKEGTVVLVPTMDHAKGREVTRRAIVVRRTYRMDPELIHFPLKKIVGVVKHG